MHASQEPERASVTLCRNWHYNMSHGHPFSKVWAIFDDTRGMVYWSVSKRGASKWAEQHISPFNGPFWLARICVA